MDPHAHLHPGPLLSEEDVAAEPKPHVGDVFVERWRSGMYSHAVITSADPDASNCYGAKLFRRTGGSWLHGAISPFSWRHAEAGDLDVS